MADISIGSSSNPVQAPSTPSTPSIHPTSTVTVVAGPTITNPTQASGFDHTAAPLVNLDGNVAPPDPANAYAFANAPLLPNGSPSTSTVQAVYGKSNILAAAGNFAVVQTSNDLRLQTVDKNGVIVGNGASLNAPQVAEAIARSGLTQSDRWKDDLKSLAAQLDSKGIKYKPGELYEHSNAGIDLVAMANGKLGAAYDWTSDATAELKGPTALNSLKEAQVAAAMLGLDGANSGLLGKNVPNYVSAALGNGPGGVIPFDINKIAGLDKSMLTQSGKQNVLSAADRAEFLRDRFDLYKNPDFYASQAVPSKSVGFEQDHAASQAAAEVSPSASSAALSYARQRLLARLQSMGIDPSQLSLDGVSEARINDLLNRWVREGTNGWSPRQISTFLAQPPLKVDRFFSGRA